MEPWRRQGGTKAKPCRKLKKLIVLGTQSVRTQVEPRWNQGGTKEEPRPQQAENLRKTKVLGPEHPRCQSGTKVEPKWNQGGTMQNPKEK